MNLPVRWACSQCGAAGEIEYAENVLARILMKNVNRHVENAHAEESPECPFDRERITVSFVLVER